MRARPAVSTRLVGQRQGDLAGEALLYEARPPMGLDQGAGRPAPKSKFSSPGDAEKRIGDLNVNKN
jgi:hypothetical protein